MIFYETFQNFIYKHTVNLENVQRNKKKDKGEVTGASSKLKLDVKISWCQKPTACSRSAVIFGFSVLKEQQNK
jgi:hypothetical protein